MSKDSLKKSFNLKKAMKGFTIVMGIALIVFMTVANITFDTGKLNLKEYICNSLILVGIMVFGLVMGESVGEDRQLEKVGGIYQTNLGEYMTVRRSIEPIEIYFPQFYQWYKEKRAYIKKINFLVDEGFDEEWAHAIVDHLEEGEIPMLEVQSIRKDDGTIIKKVTERQAKVLKYVFDGSLKLEAPSYVYYLSAHGKASNRDILEQPKAFAKEIKINKGVNRALKIVASLFISFLWSTMTVREFMSGNNAQAWLNLIARLTAFVTSFCSGWATSVIDVKIRAQVLENKTEILRGFQSCIDKKEFTPKTYEELAKAQYEAEEKAREEAIKNVVLPESETLGIEMK